MRRSIRLATAVIALSCAPALACESVVEGRVGSVWTIRLGDDASWSLPATCAAALDEVVELLAVQRRDFVRIESLLSGDVPTSLLLARIAAMASRIERALLDRGVARTRIRMREFRFPRQGSVETSGESRIIVRVSDQ